MFIRKLEEARNTARHIHSESGNWDSVRLLLAGDDMGFSFHITTLYAGTVNPMWYKNHYEAVYCVSGTAELEDLDSGTKYRIEPGTLYLLNDHDRHELRVGDAADFVCVCVFNPPLRGTEVHDPDGAYRLDAAPVTD